MQNFSYIDQINAIRRIADPEGFAENFEEPLRPKRSVQYMEIEAEYFVSHAAHGDIVVKLQGGSYNAEDEWIKDAPVYIGLKDYIDNKYNMEYEYDYISYTLYDKSIAINDFSNKIIFEQSDVDNILLEISDLGLTLESSDGEIQGVYARAEERYQRNMARYEEAIVLYNSAIARLDAARASMKSISSEKAKQIVSSVWNAYEGGKGAIKHLKNALKVQYNWAETYYGLDPIYIIKDGDAFGYFLIVDNQGKDCDINACSVDIYDLEGEMIASRYLIK